MLFCCHAAWTYQKGPRAKSVAQSVPEAVGSRQGPTIKLSFTKIFPVKSDWLTKHHSIILYQWLHLQKEEVFQHPSTIPDKEVCKRTLSNQKAKKSTPAKAVGNFKDFYDINIPQAV